MCVRDQKCLFKLHLEINRLLVQHEFNPFKPLCTMFYSFYFLPMASLFSSLPDASLVTTHAPCDWLSPQTHRMSAGARRSQVCFEEQTKFSEMGKTIFGLQEENWLSHHLLADYSSAVPPPSLPFSISTCHTRLLPSLPFWLPGPLSVSRVLFPVVSSLKKGVSARELRCGETWRAKCRRPPSRVLVSSVGEAQRALCEEATAVFSLVLWSRPGLKDPDVRVINNLIVVQCC